VNILINNRRLPAPRGAFGGIAEKQSKDSTNESENGFLGRQGWAMRSAGLVDQLLQELFNVIELHLEAGPSRAS
jgi:hypothetical protein